MTAERAVDVVVVGLGGLGSATAWQLARRGASVVGLEQFELGHVRGASHDTSRILRRSYHTPAYVRLAGEAYDDWADLERESGEQLVTRTAGVDLFPPGAAIPADDYTTSMAAEGVPFETLGRGRGRGAVAVDDGAGRHRGAVAGGHVDRARGPVDPGAAAARDARRGAAARPESPVTGLRSHDDGTVSVSAGGAAGRTYRARHVVLTADAWTNQLLAQLGTSLPLTVTREQVTYFAPSKPGRYSPRRSRCGSGWTTRPSTASRPTTRPARRLVKAGQDSAERVTTAESRSFAPDLEAETG